MTWLAQVSHVIWKDVRQTRWTLALYVAVVVVAALQATLGTLRAPTSLDVMSYLVVLTGIFVVALVVQGDSPTRADAFWASRPLQPSAVLAAKVLLAVVGLFGFAMLAQSMVFVWLGEPPAMFVRHVIRSSWMYGLWLVIAMVAAALTRDLRTFVTTLAAVPLAFSFTRLPSLFSATWLAIPAAALMALAVVGTIVGAATLVRLYRTRDGGRAARLVAGAAIVSIVLAIFTTPWARLGGRVVQQGTQQYQLFVELVNGPGRFFVTQYGVPGPLETDRITVVDSAVIRMRLNDGNSMVLVDRPHIVVEYPKLPLPNGAQWLGGAPLDRTGVGRGILTNAAQLDSLRVGVASASIEIWTWSARPSVLAVVPMRAGVSQRRGGKIIRVLNVAERRADDSLATISIAGIAAPETGMSVTGSVLAHRVPAFALANLRRGEAVIPTQQERGGFIASMVMPGLWRSNLVTTIKGGIQGYRRQPPPRLDQAWFDEASVVVYDWTLAGRTHTTIENVQVRVRDLPDLTKRRPPPAETPLAFRSPQTRSP